MLQEERIVCYDKELDIEAYRFRGLLQKFPNHFHEYYVIGFIESGARKMTCRNQEYILGSGDIVLFEPLATHTCEPLDGQALDYRCLNIKNSVMERLVTEITGSSRLPRFSEPVLYRSEQVSVLQELHQMIMAKTEGFCKEEHLYFLIGQLLAQPQAEAAPATAASAVQTAAEYLEQHYAEGISLDDLAALVGSNKYSLLRGFTRAKGITPYRYLQALRISAAKKLLEAGTQPLETALTVGFADQSHFTNVFKECIGLTPGQYRTIFC
ncbi:AraC family transcriptional regulator [uncultured Phascolarctobacterium sp.]|uniref:AraC family transcriptional regulator n=1 Tax=uncultured Phascolarctobacterium sp. TaxID=512296 RepID=UPI0025E1E6DE|nr:AraC family transcriptional regulator [uncultured Phascolarctobacterium sp.]